MCLSSSPRYTPHPLITPFLGWPSIIQQDISLILNALARLRDGDGQRGRKKKETQSTEPRAKQQEENEEEEEEEATEALVVALLHRLLHGASASQQQRRPLARALTPQGLATVVNAASRLLPEAAAEQSKLSFETLEHKRRLYRPLMLLACDLLPRMTDAQVRACVRAGGRNDDVGGMGRDGTGRGECECERCGGRDARCFYAFYAAMTPTLSLGTHPHHTCVYRALPSRSSAWGV